jgi:SnoaL-like domain
MRTIVHALVFGSALICASPLLGEALVVSDLKAFDAKITAASERCDVETVLDRISPIATISGTLFATGDTRMYRANKQQYGELLTRICAAGRTWHVESSNEKISIEGDQAFMTADLVETAVMNGQETTSKSHQRVTVELIDGKLMITGIHSNLSEQRAVSTTPPWQRRTGARVSRLSCQDGPVA